MLENAILNNIQKGNILDRLAEIKKEKLLPVLIEAALNNESFPIDNKEFSIECNSYANGKEIPVPIKKLKKVTIREWVSGTIYESIQELLLKPTFNPNKWRSSFLIFLANRLKIEIDDQSLVQLLIKQGKVQWRVVKGKKVVCNRTAGKYPDEKFDFSQAISMTWELFREFKDSGKRGGSVAITKERLIKEYPEDEETLAIEVWNQLKTEGFLDKNNRLSDKWRFATSTLDLGIEDLDYSDLLKKINRISSNEKYCETFKNWGFEAKIFRPDRSPKKVKKEGIDKISICNLKPKSDLNAVKRFDVSIYDELKSHETEGDALEHDHIPSVLTLKKKKKKDESGPKWTCIELPQALHRNGLTFMNKKEVEKPFLSEVEDYLKKLREEWKNCSNINTEYLKALGAFRYMYRCEISGKHSTTAHKFFKNDVKYNDEIDKLLLENLKNYLVKKEGNLNNLLM